MAAVSLPSLLGRKIKKFGAFFVKYVFLGILEEAIAPSAPPWLRLWGLGPGNVFEIDACARKCDFGLILVTNAYLNV